MSQTPTDFISNTHDDAVEVKQPTTTEASNYIDRTHQTVSPWSGFGPAAEITFRDVVHMSNMQLMDNGGVVGATRAAGAAATAINPLLGLSIYAVPEAASLIDSFADAGNQKEFFNEYMERMQSVATDNSKVERLLQGAAVGGNIVSGKSSPKRLSGAIQSGPNADFKMIGEAVGMLGRDLLVAGVGGNLVSGAVPALKAVSAIDTGFMTSVPLVHTINDSMTKYGEGSDVADALLYGGSTGVAMAASGGIFFKAVPKALGFLKTRSVFHSTPGMKTATAAMRRIKGGQLVQNTIEWGGWGASEHIMTQSIRSGLSKKYEFNVDWAATGEGALKWASLGVILHSPVVGRELIRLGRTPGKRLRQTANIMGATSAKSKMYADSAVEVADEMHKITHPSKYDMRKKADVLYDMVSQDGLTATKARIAQEREVQEALQLSSPFGRNITLDMLDDIDASIDTMSRRAYHDKYAEELVGAKRKYVDIHNIDNIDNAMSEFPNIALTDGERRTINNYYNATLDIMDNGAHGAPESAQYVRSTAGRVNRIKKRIQKEADAFEFGFQVSSDVRIPSRFQTTTQGIQDAYTDIIRGRLTHGGFVNVDAQKQFDEFAAVAMEKNGNSTLSFDDIIEAEGALKRYISDNYEAYRKQMGTLRKYSILKEAQ